MLSLSKIVCMEILCFTRRTLWEKNPRESRIKSGDRGEPSVTLVASASFLEWRERAEEFYLIWQFRLSGLERMSWFLSFFLSLSMLYDKFEVTFKAFKRIFARYFRRMLKLMQTRKSKISFWIHSFDCLLLLSSFYWCFVVSLLMIVAAQLHVSHFMIFDCCRKILLLSRFTKTHDLFVVIFYA